MKKTICFVITLLLGVCMILPAAAIPATPYSDTVLPLCVDEAGLLTADELVTLNGKLGEISERQSCAVIALLTDTCGGKDAQAYADDFFDYNGYGRGNEKDGILLLFAVSDGVYAFSTNGIAESAFINAGFDSILDDIRDDLKSGAYAAAFSTYAERCDTFLSHYRETGEAYGEEPFDPGAAAVISILVGAVIGLILVLRLRAKNKSVYAQTGAADYMRKDSLTVTRQNEMFLYRNVTRTERAQSSSSNNGSHTSSSGETHGGKSGRI